MPMTDHCNAVADVFQITLRKSGTKLSGNTVHRLNTIIPGANTTVKVRVVDSLIYDTVGTSGVLNVLLHLGGDLYCYALCEHKGQNIIKLFFLDGNKLGFKPLAPYKDGDVDFFPKLWSRREIFKRMLDGIVGCYWKLSNDKEWTVANDVKAMLKKYIEEGPDEVSSHLIKAAVIDVEDFTEEDVAIEHEQTALTKKLEDMSDQEYAAYLQKDESGPMRLPSGDMLDCGAKCCNWVEDVNDFWCVECGLTSGEVPELENMSLDELREAIVVE